MNMHLPPFLSLFLTLSLLSSCDRPDGPLLTPLPASLTRVDFTNTIPDNDSINIMAFEYIFNGGGVGVGDFNRDGRPDLFFTGSYVSSRLYLQEETPFEFRDVTAAAGLTTDYWCAGVSVADVDGNGWEDIYVSTLNPEGDRDTPNRLFLNQGLGDDRLPHFVESAALVGLADSSYGTQAVWVDYDRDGDLDCYLVNNAIENYNRNLAKGADPNGRGRSQDVLYENISADGRLRFQATDQVRTEGWGLGAVVQDFDRDGRPEIYVANDFISNDLLWRTDSSGRLVNEMAASLPHTSYNSMGVDAADLNNDGFSEILVVDMLPDDNLRQKTMFGEIPHQRYRTSRQRGYTDQYVRNTLQLNNGDGTFSDIALLAGVAATDWSWTPLLVDFDNDGYRDIFISNGYPKDITNRDFIDFSQEVAYFGTEESRFMRVKEALKTVGGVHQPNYLYRNLGKLVFASTDWLPNDPSYTNGAVPVDLDGDGDLDLVTNNLNEPAGIYRNQSRERRPDSTRFVTVRLVGPPANPDGLGAQVYLRSGDLRQYHEQQRQRGYLSSFGAAIHFGTGTATFLDTLLVSWPDGKSNVLTGLPSGQTVTVKYAESVAPASAPVFQRAKAQLLPTDVAGLPSHVESSPSDFDTYALALRDRSRDGPALAAGDLDGDGIDELIFGGSSGHTVDVYRQDSGRWTQVQSLSATREAEVTVLRLFDFDGDGDPDLYVGSGSGGFGKRQELTLQDRVFRNNEGVLEPVDVLPAMFPVTSAVVAADLEGDGDLDLFVGARHWPGDPHRPAPSFLLENKEGHFYVRKRFSPGLVTAALWEDFDADGLPDLLLAPDYGTPTLYRNDSGELTPDPVSPDHAGWWYSLTSTDLDGDGDLDVLAGNAGLNVPYRVSPGRPLAVRVADYDDNGKADPIVTAYNGETAYPVHPRNTLGRQLPSLKRQMPSYGDYGGWTEAELPPLGEDGYVLRINDLHSYYLENDGAGHFTYHPLPLPGQTAPIRAAVPTVLTDGRPGLLVVQNDYATEVLNGRYDAGTGFALSLDSAGQPEVLPRYWSVRADARSVVRLRSGAILVGVNGGRVLSFTRAD